MKQLWINSGACASGATAGDNMERLYISQQEVQTFNGKIIPFGIMDPLVLRVNFQAACFSPWLYKSQ
ncbi:hypothetical protein SynBIOSE41_03915 [Synechococcus sp. BIOS-E4-1]|nr:hypothetical protein SynBIOSE41_03915 [Synechococcus sp. BIOS-E4-1]